MNRVVIGFYRNLETGEEATIILDNRTGQIDVIRTKSAVKEAE